MLAFGQRVPTGAQRERTLTSDASTGLDYADQRYEQPGMGRFMSPDPYGGSASGDDPGSWNRYAYVGGDPVNNTDPTGLLLWVGPLSRTPPWHRIGGRMSRVTILLR